MEKFRDFCHKIGDFMKRFDKVYNWIIFIILCILVSFVASHHEPFRDEVQAWNIARDLSIADIFKQMYSEGHPCIWHLLLKPFTMLGLPIYSMTWISVVIMIFTAWLILFKSPFSKFVRTILVFSSPFLYFYSIISRSYCLIALAVTLLSIFYNKREQHPLIYGWLLFFLFNTHVIMAGMASILLFFFIIETFMHSLHNQKIYKFNILGCFIGFLGGIVLCLQLLGSYEANSLVQNVGVNQYGYTELSQYTNYFITQYKAEYYYLTNYYLSDVLILAIVIVLLFMILLGLLLKTKNTIIFIFSYLFSLSVCIFLFYSIPSRTVVLLFMLMFFAWTIKEEDIRQFKNRFISFLGKNYSYVSQFVLVIYCFLSIPYGIECSVNDVNLLMTDAPNIAEYIQENVSKDAIILSPSENLTTVILGYIPGYSFYSIENERYFTFITWDKSLNVLYTLGQFNLLLNHLSTSDKDIYLLWIPILSASFDSIPEKLQEQNHIQKLYESKKSFLYLNSAQEYVKFYLYKIVG